MRSIFYTIPLILLFFGPLANAQDELLTKEEAIDLVLENNLDIQVARNTKLIDENNANILNSRVYWEMVMCEQQKGPKPEDTMLRSM